MAPGVDALSPYLYKASHHNRIDTRIVSPGAVWTGPLIQDGRFYTFTSLSAGLNLSLAMILEDYGAYVAASVGQELVSARFSHEAVNHEVRVPEIS